MNAGVRVRRPSHCSRQPEPGDRRVRRQRVPGEHRDRPLQHVHGQDAAPAVMDIVGVAVVAGAQGEHRPQGGGAQRRHLEAVEAAPGDAGHPDVPVAPRLGGQPGDHIAAVPQLLGGVLACDDALGVAGAPQVHPGTGVAARGEVGVDRRVPRRHEVALPVGQEVEDRRDRGAGRIPGQPDPGRQPGPVGHRYPRVLDRAHRGACLCQSRPTCTSMTICDNSRVRLYMAVQ